MGRYSEAETIAAIERMGQILDGARNSNQTCEDLLQEATEASNLITALRSINMMGPDEDPVDYGATGNIDDSVSYGIDSAYADCAKIAAKVLKKLPFGME